MTLQSTVNDKQAFGNIGAFYDDSPRRVAPYVLDAACPVGNACTLVALAEGHCTKGGSGAFGGILVNGHEYVKEGLAASLDVPAGTNVQLCTMGHVVVKTTTAASVGYVAAFNDTTGAIEAYAASGSVPSGSTLIPNAKFVFVSAAQDGLAVLELT